jgi:hypothetical protein
LLTVDWYKAAVVAAWPACIYASITYAYLLNGRFGAQLFNKALDDGSIAALRIVLFYPFFLTTWTVWWLKHVLFLSREDPYNLVAPGLYVGRFPLYMPRPFSVKDIDPMPNEHVAIVDMCAEFPAIPWVVEQARGKYWCLPCLDGDMPEDKQTMLDAARDVARLGEDQSVFVHCANGRGRSLCFAALVLALRNEETMLREGVTFALDAAIETIQKRRPQVCAQPRQRALAYEVLEMHKNCDDVELGSYEVVSRADLERPIDGCK